MTIRIVQLLCPARHCIMAIPYTPGVTAAQDGPASDITLTEENAAAYVEKLFKELVAKKTLKPLCGICGSHELKCEDELTIYKDWDTAWIEIRKIELTNALAAAILGKY